MNSGTGPTYLRSANVVARAVRDEMVLLDLDSEQYLALDQVGARVWSLLDGEHSRDRITDVLAAEYEAPAEQIAADVDAFLEQLTSLGLVHGAS